MKANLIAHFSILKDPRIERKKLHALPDIIVLVICALVSGADGWEAIEEFGLEKEDWLKKFVPLKNGIPSHDCIAYVISRLPFEDFRDCFISWVNAVNDIVSGQIVSIDGKTTRGSRDKKKGRNPLHLVSAWANANRLVLGQETVDEKSNEIKAIPKLLELLELKGCIVTIDAMGCQQEITQKIIEKGANYSICVKKNQPHLYEAIEDFFITAEQNNFSAVNYSSSEEIDKANGRIEMRKYFITEQLETLPDTNKWKGLRSIGMAVRHCFINGKETIERRYFINSIAADSNLFAKAVRGHWGIENSLHWRLDVTFKEDASRIRKGNAPAIMATVRHWCLGLFAADTSPRSLAKKRRKAAWNDSYRANLLFGKGF